MKKLLNKLSVITVQTEDDAARFLRLGASRKSLTVSGNLKFEVELNEQELKSHTLKLKDQLSLSGEQILMGGSTHSGEEEILLDCYEQLVKTNSSLRLILAPRRPERCLEVQQLIESKGFTCILESLAPYPAWGKQSIFLVDQMGKLPLFYALATVVFIGKSLTAHGGQNLLEPACLGKVVLFGPHMENFRNIADEFLREKAAFEVKDKTQLVQTIQTVLASESLRQASAQRAKWMVEKNKGALLRVLKEIERPVQWLR